MRCAYLDYSGTFALLPAHGDVQWLTSSSEGDRQLVPGMLTVLEKGQCKFQIGSNNNLFDFTYIGNSAYAHILASECLLSIHAAGLPPKTDRTPDGEAMIITNGQPVYFWDFPRAIWALRGHVQSYYIKMPLEIGLLLAGAAEAVSWLTGKEPGFTRFRVKFSCWNRYFNIAKAKRLLGYEPIVGLQEGLVKTLKWWDEEQERKAAEAAAKKGQ